MKDEINFNSGMIKAVDHIENVTEGHLINPEDMHKIANTKSRVISLRTKLEEQRERKRAKKEKRLLKDDAEDFEINWETLHELVRTYNEYTLRAESVGKQIFNFYKVKYYFGKMKLVNGWFLELKKSRQSLSEVYGSVYTKKGFVEPKDWDKFSMVMSHVETNLIDDVISIMSKMSEENDTIISNGGYENVPALPHPVYYFGCGHLPG